MNARLTALIAAVSFPGDAAMIADAFEASVIGTDGSATVIRQGRETVRVRAPKRIDVTGAVNAIAHRTGETTDAVFARLGYTAPVGRDTRNVRAVAGLQKAYDKACGLKK